jgi:hypothetical protein
MSFKAHGNYCGPGWSDGKWQNSVVGTVKPKDYLDFTCQQHDAAYATGKDKAKADFLFAKQNILGAFKPGKPANIKQLAMGLGVGAQGLGRTTLSMFGLGGDIKTKLPSQKEFQYNINQKDLIQIKSNNNPHTNFNFQEGKDNMPRGKNTINKNMEKNLERAIRENTRVVTEFQKRSYNPIAKANQIRSRASKGMYRSNKILADFDNSVAVSTAPVSIGTCMTTVPPLTRSTQNGVSITGREFLDNVQLANNANWLVASIAPLHPAYYPASIIGNTMRAYQFYRFKRLVVHFVTRKNTSLDGEIVIGYSANALDPPESGSASTFLARAMTRGPAVLGPLWQNISMAVPLDAKFRLCDAFNASTYADNVNGEIQVYTQTTGVATTDNAGYIIMDYEIEFKATMFTPHSTRLPLTTGASTYEVSTTVAATTSGNRVVVPSAVAALPTVDIGSIFKLVFNRDGCVAGSGATLDNVLGISTYTTFATSGTVSQSLNPVSISDGLTLYGLVSSPGFFVLYSTLDSAIGGDANGQVFFNTTTTSTSTFAYQAIIVRLAPAILTSAQ